MSEEAIQTPREDIVKQLMEADSGMRTRALLNLGLIEEGADDLDLEIGQVTTLVASIPESGLPQARTESYKARAPRDETMFRFDGAAAPVGLSADPYRRAMVEYAFTEQTKIHKEKTKRPQNEGEAE